MSSVALDQPVKAPVFRGISIGRRLKNAFATTLFVTSFLIAMVPLVWLLWVVVKRGWYAVTRPAGGPTRCEVCCPSSSPAGCTTRSTGR
ncbi:phosphate-transport integral membrane ABC transporter PstA1 domain protein [Mycobacterium xenopi 3993]|nr:phosphate-transport integral membrane ABC transporter PstA1 domain protein [Mycobacterium xenopi 3993]